MASSKRYKRTHCSQDDDVWNVYNYTENEKNTYAKQLVTHTNIDKIIQNVKRAKKTNKNKNENVIVELKNNINSKTWISATQTKNFMLDDHAIDWLMRYFHIYGICDEDGKHKDIKYINNQKLPSANTKNLSSSVKFLCDGGNSFEDKIYQEMSKKYNNNFVIVLDDNEITKYQERESIDKLMRDGNNKVKSLMKKGVPIIAQAPLINDENFTYGVADLLVRSDYLKIIFNQFDEDDDINHASTLNKKYHYRIIDIKWTTMSLCVDGKTLRNEGYFPAYKAQLAIYTSCLKSLQGYVPSKAYIMAKGWKIEKNGQKVNNRGYSPFDRAGVIDYKCRDNIFIKKTKDAIKWVQRVMTEGNKWRYEKDKPTVTEMYPNINKSINPTFDKIKYAISKQYGNPTLIWYVNNENRKKAFEQGVYSIDDPKCTSDTLGIKSPERAIVIDKILEINRNEHENISPKIIKNNMTNWQIENELDYYIDFETINYNLFLNPEEINLEQTSFDDSGITFMIGIGFKKNEKIDSNLLIKSLGIDKSKYNYIYNCDNEWEFVNIYITNFELSNELEIYRLFFQFIIVRQNLINPNGKSKLFHWTDAELRFMEKAIERIKTGKYTNEHMSNTSIIIHNNGNYLTEFIDEFNNYVEYIDMCNVFIKEPIVIKGAYRFKLKQIGAAFYNHGYIKTKWENGKMSDGFKAMIEAIVLYRANTNITNENNSFNEIIKYNEIDCKVIFEIVTYLRSCHVK